MRGLARAQIADISQIIEPSSASCDQHLIEPTYMGPRKESTASLGLHTAARSVDFALFVPFCRPGLDHGNEGAAVRTAELSAGEIDAFVARMALFQGLVDDSFDPLEPFLSDWITRPEGLGGDVVAERLYDAAETEVVLGTLENRFLATPAAKGSVHSLQDRLLRPLSGDGAPSSGTRAAVHFCHRAPEEEESMAGFPSAPVSASEFFERFLPTAFAEAGLSPLLAAVDLPLGVLLVGEGGGEWLLEASDGGLRVLPGSRSAAAFTVVQTVEDWRGALWEGRGGPIGRHAAAIFRPGGDAVSAIAELVVPSAAALPQLQALSGLVRVAITGGEGGDWALGLKLGPGEIPAEATTSVTLGAADIDAMLSGQLSPLEAFLGGRVQIAGDLTLLMQIQAIQMQAAEAARSRRAG